MLEANLGYYFSDTVKGEVLSNIDTEEVGHVQHLTKATHGYSPYKKDYTTVFIAKGCGIETNVEIESMCLVDEGPTMAKLLGIKLEGTDGRVIDKIVCSRV
jgi:predicted AlkP superfamily pyrophosphatase or phosphodiesterase